MTQRRLIWSLGAGLVVVLVALAGVIGYIVADKGDDTQAAATSSPYTGIIYPQFPAEPPKLRATLESFLGEAKAAEANANGGDVDYLAVLQKYATPECGAIFQGLYDAFGSGEDESTETVEIISVNESGTAGVTVTRGADGDETQHWVLRDNAWKFTCEGIFDQDPVVDTELAPADTSPTVVYPGSPALGDQCPHSDLNVTSTSNMGETIRCLADSAGDYVWQTDAGVTQEDPAVAGQEAWGKCMQTHTAAECREIVDGG